MPFGVDLEIKVMMVEGRINAPGVPRNGPFARSLFKAVSKLRSRLGRSSESARIRAMLHQIGAICDDEDVHDFRHWVPGEPAGTAVGNDA